jgi:signal transduction histidine kinase
VPLERFVHGAPAVSEPDGPTPAGAALGSAVALCTEAGRLVGHDAQLADLFGVPADRRARTSALGATAEACAALEQAIEARCPGALRWAPGAPPSTVELLLPDGRVVERSGALLEAPGGRVCVASFRDVTPPARPGPPGAEGGIARLALAERIASTVTLAAGVAHELNSPLAYVTANLAFLAEGASRLAAIVTGSAATPDDAALVAQLADAMREARSGVERMRAILRDLGTFARGGDDRLGPVDLSPVLDACANLAWGELRARARLVRDLGPVPPVLGSDARLAQLFVNLVVNALEAIPPGRPDEHEVAISSRLLPDGRVAVEVRDTGRGIPEADLPRIFDPFFTTKPPGAGTGLGLAICHAIVTAVGGAIEVESAVGRGSTFRVVLRVAPPPAAPGSSAPRAD